MIRNNARAVVIKDGHILLVKSLEHGFYFLPGGGLEFGETLCDAIAREFMEETGIADADAKGIIGMFENIFVHDGEKYHHMEHLVETELPDRNVVSLEDHIAFEWIRLEDMAKIRYFPMKLAGLILEWHRSPSFILGFEKPE